MRMDKLTSEFQLALSDARVWRWAAIPNSSNRRM